jgi:hypothetical protein
MEALKKYPQCKYSAADVAHQYRRIMMDDIQIKREIVLEADAESLEKLRKEGHARGFTVYCDEAERTGGDNSAPPPLAYFALSLAF